jgi:F0F1-type ATP synthase membrane subunit c/vacuolar-type H+-ATPase subunit K
MSTRRRSKIGSIALAMSVATSGVPARADPPNATDATSSTPDDPMSDYRAKFKTGMDRYNAGAISEAIGYWEPIYRQLGPHNGYRVAYDLGVAYSHLGDASRAAERLQAFLDEVGARRAAGRDLEPIVAKEESDARDRIDHLAVVKARIRVAAVDPPVAVQIDSTEPRIAGFVAWLDPGEHTVTFEPETPSERATTVHAAAGEIVDVAIPPPRPAPTPTPTTPAPTPTPTTPAPTLTPTTPTPTLTPTPAFTPASASTYVTTRPFSPIWLAASGGVEIAAVTAAVVLESHAFDVRRQLIAGSTGAISQSDRNGFANDRTWAYTAVGAAVGIGALTAALASWYFLGSSKQGLLVRPSIQPEQGGAEVGATARY